MGMNFSSGWIFRGWILLCVMVIFYAQDAVSKSVQCEENHYLRDSRCCTMCQPGERVLSHCTESDQTTCSKCNHHEYQPGWNAQTTCIPKKYCDAGKGFMRRNEENESFTEEEPCRCQPGRQCYHINCEFCELIPSCPPGSGLEDDPGSTYGRTVCAACKEGFYSDMLNAEQCKPWTNCKAEGRRELQPGSAQADAVCGQHVPVTLFSWVLVSVLSVITVLCLLILLLFCYKDKLKLLSVNLRSCVQNLKRTRIQQETLAPLYHSGTAGEGPGGFKCAPCEVTKLILQAPHSPDIDPPCTVPASISFEKFSPPSAERMEENRGVKERTVTEDDSKGSGEPEELSEEEVVNSSMLLAGSCTCVIPIHEPLEVGENEDCSQAVIPGMSGTCSCGGLEGEQDREKTRKDRRNFEKVGERVIQERIGSSIKETCVTSLVPLSSPLIHTSPPVPLNPSTELCVPLAQVRPKDLSNFSENLLVKQEELYRVASTHSTSAESSTAPAMLVSALMASTSAGDLYLDKSPQVSRSETGQGISCRDSTENKLGESELGCSPESLHSQLAESSLTSGLVSGHHNTTYISSGQVMNVTGDVVVVYISQVSGSSDEGAQDSDFGSPVQEEASETAPFFQSSLRSQRNCITQSALREETLPVQEMMQERLLVK
ncbi:tumor necrosis factor receptor superfamily member 11A [Nematolebias whitei]|uniref:tumor necrosis factor receptor superfamily member 11A n=1 Tax=Nematolebias whitei TaxID=451745 RepID=UPI00189B7FEB|nr:tumor necrosis factor receptor superfamily member 11A [Nematolebias whitei]